MACYGMVLVSVLWFAYAEAWPIGVLFLNALAALAYFVRRVERERRAEEPPGD